MKLDCQEDGPKSRHVRDQGVTELKQEEGEWETVGRGGKSRRASSILLPEP